jgi:hypothetical protein
VGFGDPPRFGTSAAQPNLAAVAAKLGHQIHQARQKTREDFPHRTALKSQANFDPRSSLGCPPEGGATSYDLQNLAAAGDP